MDMRLAGLLAYLDRLLTASHAGYKCNTEIAEAISAIREELVLTKG